MLRDIASFDSEHAAALLRTWFVGDLHGELSHIVKALHAAAEKPAWLVFLGDVDIDHRPFRDVLTPLRQAYPEMHLAFIHGNHDADTYGHWQMLHDCGDAVPLHGKVVDLSGIKVAGLGGNFLGRIWHPPEEPKFRNKQKAMNRGAFQWRDGQRPNPSLNAAIYPDDFDALSRQRADILVTHEAPGCHPYGFAALDELARSMRVVRSFHGHQHDDRSDEYFVTREARGYDAYGVGLRSITNGLGQRVFETPREYL